MCLISFAWQPGTPMPLRLMGNRDEFHARPTAPLGEWQDNPAIVGGRDLEAGGSWLAAKRGGVVAALTNVRDPQLGTPPGAPSRGELVADALQCSDIKAWLTALSQGEAMRYAGFNLLVATPQRLWHLHRSRGRLALTEVAPGFMASPTLISTHPGQSFCMYALRLSTLFYSQTRSRHGLVAFSALCKIRKKRLSRSCRIPAWGLNWSASSQRRLLSASAMAPAPPRGSLWIATGTSKLPNSALGRWGALRVKPL